MEESSSMELEESRRKKGDKEEDIEEIVGYGVAGAAYSFGFAKGMKRLSPSPIPFPFPFPSKAASPYLSLSQSGKE